jgi:hypothetical protein
VGEFGIGLTDDDGFYSFRINLTDNTFRVSRYDNSTGWDSVSEILDMPSPLTASDRMALGVLVDGNRLEFYINDMLVAETTSVNPNLSEGYTVAPVAQVSADEIIVVRLDDLEVWLLDTGNIDVDI